MAQRAGRSATDVHKDRRNLLQSYTEGWKGRREKGEIPVVTSRE